ncbi:hypothetical protein BC567DRAFT_206110 [Phyllosticta citribraziliensis]
MILICILFLSSLLLTSGYPLGTDDSDVSPASKLSPRTDISSANPATDLLAKRDVQPNTCYAPYRFCESYCAGPGANTLFWTCVVPATGTRTLPYSKPCGDLVCISRFLGTRNDEPAPGCGGKAACVSIPRLVHIAAKKGTTTCGGVNAADNGRNVQLISRIFDAAQLALGVKSVRAPDQIILSDGPNTEIQRVGPADEQNGIFISKVFKYIGGVKECVRLASYEADMDVYSALILR